MEDRVTRRIIIGWKHRRRAGDPRRSGSYVSSSLTLSLLPRTCTTSWIRWCCLPWCHCSFFRVSTNTPLYVFPTALSPRPAPSPYPACPSPPSMHGDLRSPSSSQFPFSSSFLFDLWTRAAQSIYSVPGGPGPVNILN